MKKRFIFSILTLALFLLVGTAAAQTPVPHTETFTTTGTATWNAPEGAYQITKIEAWGGGGGGGNAANGSNAHSAGSGGGGGAYAAFTDPITLSSVRSLSYMVGAGGAGGNDGKASSASYDGTLKVQANGGNKGASCKNDGSANGGNGGTVAVGSGFSGGKGGNAATTSAWGTGIGGSAQAGGGGGAAGRTSNGNSANAATAGAANVPGGAGAAGYATLSRNTDNKRGNDAPNGYGGGGGGAIIGCWANLGGASNTGGSGANGAVIVTYTTLTLTITLNNNHGGTSTFDIPYYNLFGDNLTTPSLDNHIFLGWFTAPTGGTQVTATDRCIYERNTTLYAHWLDAGDIAAGPVTLSTPCSDYTVHNAVLATADGHTITYFWKYKFNEEPLQTLNVDKDSLTQDDLTLTKVGTYVFTRYAAVSSPDTQACSLNSFTLVLEYNPGAVTSNDTTEAYVNDGFVVNASEVENCEYRWMKNSELMPGESNQNLTIAAQSLCPGTYVYKREVKVKDCPGIDWKVSNDSCKIVITFDADSIDKATVEVNQDYEAFTINGKPVTDGKYQWYCNEEEITGAEDCNLEVAAGLCPDSTYVFTRKVSIKDCEADAILSENAYSLTVKVNAGEITAKDTTVNYDYAPITIQGDEIVDAEYQWKINGEVVAESNVQNYIISAGLCPDSVYNFTREVKINCGNAQWHASANTYTLRVEEINAGEITANDTTVNYDYAPITIQGDEIAGAEYQWKINGEVVAESNVQNYIIPAGLCPDSVYNFTREVKINCGNAQWHASANTYTLRVEINAGEITANDTTVNYDYAPITIQGDEIVDAEYQWKINGEVVAESNVQNYIISAGLCPDSVYNFTREVKINCGNAQWHASANTYTLRVEINAGEITANDTTVKHNYEPITIQGDEIVGAAYQWKKNGEVIAESNVQNYTIPTGLCPDDYTFTREVKIAVCEQSQWLPSANSYKLTVEINPGEIVSKDTSITTGESLTIEGDNLGEGTSYQWLKNGVDIEGATEQNYILSAENLCPGEQFIFTRQISINDCIGATATSANEYKVMISVGAIEAKDITVDPGYVATIDADNLPGVQYQWYLNGSEIPGATEYNYQITELCEIGEYVFTRKVKGAECANWYNSENEYKVTVKAIAGKIDADAIYVCSDLTGKQIGSIEDAQGDVVVYSWKYNKNDGEWINADTNRNSLTEADLNAICADAASEDVYAFQRYAKIGCMSNPVASEGTAKIYFSSTSGDELVAHDMSYHFNYGEDFLWRDSLLLPDLIHNGEIRPSDWVYEINAPAEKIYPAPGTNKATITWSITDKCGATFNATQTITFLLPACGDEYTVTDVDGNEYASVRIGLDCWMAENLKTTHYADGTLVPNVRSYKGHKDYPDTVQNAQTFGLLYTWNAVMKNTTPATADEMVQGICPDDWALPTAAYFERMMSVDVKTLRTTDYWLVANGTNTTGFSMLPAGRYNDVHNRCENLLGNAYFWSSTTYNNTEVKTFEADCHCYKWQEVSNPKTAGLSLRCVRVKFEPIVISTDSATNLTKTSATLNGTVSSLGDYDELNVGFKYGANVHVLTSIVALEDAITAPDEFSYDIDGLTPNTRYYYRAFATSGMDTVWGALKSFITPVIAVTTDSANTVTKNSAKLHGNVLNTAGYPELNVGFRYGQLKNNMVLFAEKADPITTTGSYNVDLSSLSPNTTYYFQAYAYNETDTAWAVDTLSFRTLTVPCLGAVRTNERGTTDAIDSVIDNEGNAYVAVKIGNQCWMAENLRTKIGGDGDKGYPTGVGADSLLYGRLYTWTAMMNGKPSSGAVPSGVRGICPEGWHVPSDSEWTQLEHYVNSQIEYICGYVRTNIAKALASTTGWNNSESTCAVGNDPSSNNATGFNAVPAGYYWFDGFYDFGSKTAFWSAAQRDDDYAWSWNLYSNGSSINGEVDNKATGLSVRCLRDPMTVTTDSANTVTSNSAKLYGNVTSMGKYTEVNAGFKYGTSESALTSIVVKDAAMDATGLFSCDIDGLTANTTYFFKAFAANGTDTVYGEVKNFTVLSVTTDSANTVTKNSATLHGNVTSMGKYTKVNAGFKYGTSESTLTSIASDGSAMVATGRFSYTITGLTANTQYYFKAFAANGTDTVYGEVKNFTTTVMAVTTDSANTITYNSAKLYANVKNMGGMTSLNAGFKYGTSVSALTSIVTKSDAVTATGSYNCEITGLTSNTIYYYKAFAANGTDTVWGEVKNFTSAFACGDTVKDVENNKYKTVEIGTQCWMAENLKTTHYANGNTWQNQIQTVTTATTSSNGCCYRPGNADTNVPTYGYLYNWHAVANTSNGGLCPTGWHVPTDAEWTTMTDYVGNQSGYQCNHQKANIAKALASKSNWNSSTGGGTTCNVGNDLTTNNATGFSALPAGTFSGSDTRFENLKSATRFWTATGSGSNATCRIMEYNSANVTSKNNVGKTSAYSVRCVKD